MTNVPAGHFDFDKDDIVRVRVRDDDDNTVVDFTSICLGFEYYPGDDGPIALFKLPQAHSGRRGKVGYDAFSAEFEVVR